jgi:hypothetical protein
LKVGGMSKTIRSAVCCSSLVALVAALGGCATVKPQERAVLADPVMQFDGDAYHTAALHHAIENREGSAGGAGVSGGGCGCN